MTGSRRHAAPLPDEDTRSGGPRYAAIKAALQDAVDRGAMRPGDRVPSEAELVRQFNVSRMTANRALRELQDAGMVVRRPGIGSFIAERRPIGQMIEIRNIADEINARGHEYRADVILNIAERATARTATLLGVSIGTALYHSEIIHREAGVPLQLEERHVLASIAPGYDKVDFSRMTPNAYLTGIAPIERAEHRVTASVADSQTAARLEMTVGSAILILTRLTWSGGRLVSHARLIYPADRYELTASFTVSATKR